MGEVPAEWLERLALHARAGLDRLELKRRSDASVMEYRRLYNSGTTSLQGRPQCPSCWGYISEEQWAKFKGVRRTLVLNFECPTCKRVFPYSPKSKGKW